MLEKAKHYIGNVTRGRNAQKKSRDEEEKRKDIKHGHGLASPEQHARARR